MTILAFTDVVIFKISTESMESAGTSRLVATFNDPGIV
jgi:hypothetical protein